MRISKSNKIVKASTSTNFKYADKVKFEDIYPSDRDITFFFTSDDAEYAKELLGDIKGLSGFSIEVSLPKDYSGNWQDALIYISPNTEDGNSGSSDSDWTDITFEISDADMKSLVDQSWKEYKKRGWDDSEVNASCNDVTSSKKLSANDKALQHIKAAIDILGNSGNRDDVTKDSIANLATVMFDIQGSTIKSSSYKTEIGGIKVTVTPRYSMGYEDGYDVSGKHSDGSDAGHKYYNMRNLGGKYYNAKGFDKDRAMSDLAQKFIDDIGWDNKMKMD